MVQTGARNAAEVTNLGVDPLHREQGIGKLLLASAARTGMQFGNPKVTLAAQDNGSGRLTRWYQGIGFARVGRNEQGFPALEAPVWRVVSRSARAAPVAPRVAPWATAQRRARGHENGSIAFGNAAGSFQHLAIQRMEQPIPNYSFDIKSGHQPFHDRIERLIRDESQSAMTIHHKTSQSRLTKLTVFLGFVMDHGSGPQKQKTLELIGKLEKYVKVYSIPSSSIFSMLNNMPLNLAYGPTARWHHMGELFDGAVDLQSPVDQSVDQQAIKTFTDQQVNWSR